MRVAGRSGDVHSCRYLWPKPFFLLLGQFSLERHTVASRWKNWMTLSKEVAMSSQTYEPFFLQPSDPVHRRYETLRAVFVDKQPMNKVAQRFDVHYGTVRNWASEFRAQQDAQQTPPFSFRHNAAARQSSPTKNSGSNPPMCRHSP